MVTSGAAQHPHEGESSYCAGKAAIDQWVRVVGLEQHRRVGRPGCRVVAIAPGAVGTAMQDQIRASPDHVFPQAPRFRDMKRDGALAQPTDVARAIWSVLDRDIDNGAVLHIRGLT